MQQHQHGPDQSSRCTRGRSRWMGRTVSAHLYAGAVVRGRARTTCLPLSQWERQVNAGRPVTLLLSGGAATCRRGHWLCHGNTRPHASRSLTATHTARTAATPAGIRRVAVHTIVVQQAPVQAGEGNDDDPGDVPGHHGGGSARRLGVHEHLKACTVEQERCNRALPCCSAGTPAAPSQGRST